MTPTDRTTAEAAVRAVFARAGQPIGAGSETLDRRLAQAADRGAELYRRAVEDDEGPLDALADLLILASALREVLGMGRTPVNAEVYN